MKSLQLSDYKGIIQYLGFERKMMNDIDIVCKDGHHKSKKTYIKKRVRRKGHNNYLRDVEELRAIFARSPRIRLIETAWCSHVPTRSTC